MGAAVVKWVRVREDSGFALPSVLMLVTLLTLVALSVLTLQRVRQLQALSEVARVKADYAAQSAIACAAAERQYWEQGHLLAFPDSSSAAIRTLPWGILKLAVVQGSSARIRSRRITLLGAAPPAEYKNAICYGSPSRQLILTGSTQITGTVLTGTMGPTVGTLPGEKQPRHLPVAGRVTRKPGVLLPAVDRQLLETTFAPFLSFLRGGISSEPSTPFPLRSADCTQNASAAIPDSVESVDLNGNTPFGMNLIRRESPLTVRVQGTLTIKANANIEGAVAFYVSGGVRIERGARIDNAVVMSGDLIIVENGVTMRGQMIAPLIKAGTHCTFSYPSILCSYPLPGRSAQRVELAAGSRCEGMVILFSEANSGAPLQPGPGGLVTLHRDAAIVGALYSERPVTLDGTVTGSAVVSDFYFYQAPTSYYGWLRSARIDRRSLPEGFAVPETLGGGKGEVMLWL